jgi:hypothetical protein
MNPTMLAEVDWRPLGFHPVLLGVVLLVAGTALLWHARVRHQQGTLRPHGSHWLPVIGAVDPEIFWGLGLFVSGIGALLAAD